MKTPSPKCLWLLWLVMLCPGCVSVPPLIQVQHKENNNAEVMRRLDAIDRRLDHLERKMEPR